MGNGPRALGMGDPGQFVAGPMTQGLQAMVTGLDRIFMHEKGMLLDPMQMSKGYHSGFDMQGGSGRVSMKNGRRLFSKLIDRKGRRRKGGAVETS
ncbi:hypothetical protein AA13595_0393 [Gluconacetobacter johannae DSM 13595]|nr:hypothetical protein AA13595_0393 [Gluconacetobacter johannae DSM 13595]